MSISCDCSIYDDDDGPELWAGTFPVARKEHVCCECGETIKSGQKYSRDKGLWDGVFLVFKTCMTCYSIREHYCPKGFAYGRLVGQLRDCLGFDYRKIVSDE